jgi:TonB family protein
MTIRRTIPQAVAICILSLTASLAVAQESKSCVPKDGAPDSSHRRSIEMLGTLVPAGETADVPAMYLATLLQEIQLVFNAPDTLAELSSGQMSMWLHSDGRLTNPVPADTTLSRDLARPLAIAIDSASRLGGIGPVFPKLGADSVPLRLVIHYADRRTPLSISLLRFASSPAYFEFQVEKPALPKRGNPAPKYPAGLRQSGVEGEVLAQFIVSREGRAEMRSFRVLKSAHEDFVIAVREVLPRLRFSPAEVHGCPVRQLVQLPFAFKLNW